MLLHQAAFLFYTAFSEPANLPGGGRALMLYTPARPKKDPAATQLKGLHSSGKADGPERPHAEPQMNKGDHHAHK